MIALKFLVAHGICSDDNCPPPQVVCHFHAAHSGPVQFHSLDFLEFVRAAAPPPNVPRYRAKNASFFAILQKSDTRFRRGER